MFDIESSIFLNNKNHNFDNHVFITGLARSGTSILLNEIYKTNQFASLTYEDMPFILAPNLWNKIKLKSKPSLPKERMHEDGIKINTNSPEAFEEVFWKTFSDDLNNREDYFKNFVTLILKKNKINRYLSKNNQNIDRLLIINKIFPKSK